MPPPTGKRIVTIEPGTYLGPVEDYMHNEQFATICVRGYWINVWRVGRMGLGIDFARLVPESEVDRWRSEGWYDA